MVYDLYAQLESFDTRLTMNTLNFLMSEGENIKVPAGQVVSKEGDPSEHVFIIVEGVARIEKKDGMGGRIMLAEVGNGGLIGEMGVFLDMKRSATVVAKTDLSLVRFTNENFVNALPRTPDITVRLLKSLALKLDQANRRYSSMAFQNAVLQVGLHLLDHECSGSSGIRFEVAKVARETGLAPGKIVSALKTLQKEGFLGPWTLGEGKVLSFDVDHTRLRDALKMQCRWA